MNEQSQLAALRHWLKGDEAAVQFCAAFYSITQVWDDLVDKDRPVEPGEVSEAFEMALVHMAANPFYNQHFRELQPLIIAGINAWHDSNDLIQMGGTDNYARAYMLRDVVGEVMLGCARIIGGYQWMRTVSLEARLALINDESFEDFCKELTHEH